MVDESPGKANTDWVAFRTKIIETWAHEGAEEDFPKAERAAESLAKLGRDAVETICDLLRSGNPRTRECGLIACEKFPICDRYGLQPIECPEFAVPVIVLLESYRFGIRESDAEYTILRDLRKTHQLSAEMEARLAAVENRHNRLMNSEEWIDLAVAEVERQGDWPARVRAAQWLKNADRGFEKIGPALVAAWVDAPDRHRRWFEVVIENLAPRLGYIAEKLVAKIGRMKEREGFPFSALRQMPSSLPQISPLLARGLVSDNRDARLALAKLICLAGADALHYETDLVQRLVNAMATEYLDEDAEPYVAALGGFGPAAKDAIPALMSLKRKPVLPLVHAASVALESIVGKEAYWSGGGEAARSGRASM